MSTDKYDDDAPVEDLQKAVRDLHGVESTYVETRKVREVSDGATVWEGGVAVFNIVGHPLAKQAYVWSYLSEQKRRRFVAILGAGPITSPERAVQAYVVNEVRKRAN